jgi:hypothetical protein
VVYLNESDHKRMPFFRENKAKRDERGKIATEGVLLMDE